MQARFRPCGNPQGRALKILTYFFFKHSPVKTL
jgi:hypothetical protein